MTGPDEGASDDVVKRAEEENVEEKPVDQAAPTPRMLPPVEPESEPFLLSKARSHSPSTPPPESTDDAAPLSLRDAIQEEDEETVPLSLRDQIPESERAAETLSLRDINLVTDDGTPAPPPAGALRTLPPKPLKEGTAPPPPPTISLEPGPKSEKAAAPLSAQLAPEEPKRGWVVPALAVAGVLLVVWRIMARAPAEAPTTTTTPAAVKTITAGTTVVTSPAEPSATPSAAVVVEPMAPVAKRSGTGPAAKTAAKEEAAEPADAGASAAPDASAEYAALSMSELLDRAGSAKRSGDYTTARALYERVLQQNPGNVEANGGLGDVLRGQGDLAAAKASYERALASSPANVPALLGVADSEWDLGEKGAARIRYIQIVDRLGERAPERAKQRSVATE